MERSAFEHMYEQTRKEAISKAKTVCGSWDVADGAVQEAAMYFLTGISKKTGQPFVGPEEPRITPALFIDYACNRARDMVRTDPRHASGVRIHERAVGTALDLDRHLYGPPDDES